MKCYRNGGCGPYEMRSCSECPASKEDYLRRTQGQIAFSFHKKISTCKKCGTAVYLDEPLELVGKDGCIFFLCKKCMRQ